MTQEVLFEVRLPVKITKKTNYYVGSCSILDVFTQGETEKEAKGNLREALGLFLISCYERGVLNEVLRKSGFSPSTHRQQPASRGRKSQPEMLKVPLPMTFDSHSTLKPCPA